MRNKSPRTELLFVVALAGLGLGGFAQTFHARGSLDRHVASAAIESQNSYEKLRCLGDAEYRGAAVKLNMDVPAGISICEDKTHGPLSKLFRLASDLRIHFPATWAPSLQADLHDPIGYLDKMSEKVDFDFSQVTSIAFNKKFEKKIYLGGSFFTQDPLEALSVLVHEARHSSNSDPGHVICSLGDIPKTSGGCDERFSLKESDAGAYSYGAAFYAAVGLFGENLSPGDREYMLSKALATVGTRFNRLPPALAAAHDLVAILDDQHNVSFLHPFSPEPVPLVLSFLREGETVERVEFSVRNNGLMLFTSAQRLVTWSTQEGFRSLYKDVLNPEAKVLDANRIRVPFGDYPFFNFLLPDNDLRYVQFGADEGKNILTPYPMRQSVMSAVPNPPELSRFFMALGGASIFLDKGGIFSMGARFGNEQPFVIRQDLNISTRAWVYGNGGVMADSLYAIDDTRVLQSATVELVPLNEWDDYEEEKISWHPSRFQADGAKKFQEGLFLRGLLSENGQLRFESFDGSRPFTWALGTGRIVDFAISRTHSVSTDIFPVGDATACGLRDSVREPWFGHLLGLDTQGRLVDGSDCRILGPRTYRSLRLVPAAESSATDEKSSGEPARLQVFNEAGQSEILRPYETR
ncbi:MAG: hypothetical protein AB7K68_02745 [Bacteriovoracia bacterium]